MGNDRIVDVEQDSGAIHRHSQIDKNQSFLARALDVLEKALGSASTQSETYRAIFLQDNRGRTLPAS